MPSIVIDRYDRVGDMGAQPSAVCRGHKHVVYA
jgi:hypothetical protein